MGRGFIFETFPNHPFSCGWLSFNFLKQLDDKQWPVTIAALPSYLQKGYNDTNLVLINTREAVIPSAPLAIITHLKTS